MIPMRKGTAKKWHAVSLSFVSIIIEVISMGCTVSFGHTYMMKLDQACQALYLF